MSKNLKAQNYIILHFTGFTENEYRFLSYGVSLFLYITGIFKNDIS